jgi:hypothetical protein
MAIVVNAVIADSSSSLLSPESARLLGWLLTDGYWRTRKHSPGSLEAVLYQHPKKFLAEVIAVAGGTPRAPHPDTGTITVPVTQDRLLPLRPYLVGRSKKTHDWIDVVTRLSREAAAAMFDAMYKADGTTAPSRNGDFIARRVDKGPRATIVVLANLLGYRTYETARGISLSKQRRLWMSGVRRSREHYRGKVWCPVTPNGTWVMRQGEVVIITGNTFTSRNLALQTSQVVTNPRIANGYYRFFNSFQTEKNPEKVSVERDLFPQYLRNQFAISAGPGRAPQMTRWIMGLDLPIRDLNRFWNGDLASTFQNEWLNNLGPVPGLGEALYAMMGGAEAGSDLERGVDAGSPVYSILSRLRRAPGPGRLLADWLEIRDGFDSQGRITVKANPARVKALAVLTAIDSPLRDMSRFLDSSDSPISAWARYLTGVRFEEMNPELERRRRLKTAYDRAGQYLTGARRELETYFIKEGVEPGRGMERGPAPAPPTETIQ